MGSQKVQGWVKQLTQAFSWAETVQGRENLRSAEGNVASANILTAPLGQALAGSPELWQDCWNGQRPAVLSI